MDCYPDQTIKLSKPFFKKEGIAYKIQFEFDESWNEDWFDTFKVSVTNNQDEMVILQCYDS